MKNTNMQNIEMNNKSLVINENQSKIEFLKNLKSLRMCLNGVDKNRDGYGYKYQDFNEIIREIKQVIKENNLDIDFVQCPTVKLFGSSVINVITTTFYSTQTGYEYSFDTPIYTEEMKSIGVKNQNTLPQLVGSCITYFKRYALVAYLSIESEVDNDVSALDPRHEENNKAQDSSIDNPQVEDINEKGKFAKEITVNKAKKINSVKFNCYKSLLIAARSMHKFLHNKPFSSVMQINSYLSALKVGNDSLLLEYFSKNKDLKSAKYWIGLIREYIIKNNNIINKLDQFDAFVAFERDKYQDSSLKLFGCLSGELEFKYLFETYRIAS